MVKGVGGVGWEGVPNEVLAQVPGPPVVVPVVELLQLIPEPVQTDPGRCGCLPGGPGLEGPLETPGRGGQ